MWRPKYADVAATLALVLAMGGTSYAVASIPQHSVGKDQLQPRAVTKAKLADGIRDALEAAKKDPGGGGGGLDPTKLVHATSPVVTVDPGTRFLYVAAPCLGGATALSGGYTITGTVRVTGSIRSSFQQSWQIEVENLGTSPGTAQAFSVCLNP
jgi:hypothetical protein